MIVGIGVDIAEISRLGEALRRTPALAARLFAKGEQGGPASALAACFAAKEAVSKSFTTGIGAELGWRSVSVYHGERNQPLVRLDEKGQALLRDAGATHVLLTLSHTATVAMAVAALVRAQAPTP